MKQYVLDQLRESDYERIKEYLNKHADRSIMDEIYWVNLPESLYNPIQAEHTRCRPFYFAVQLTMNEVAFEFLIRSREIMRCSCIAYATPPQRDYILQFADTMLDELQIKI